MTQLSTAGKRGGVPIGQFANVKENWILYDSILVNLGVGGLAYNDGWFTSYTQMGLQTEFPFFNVRNKNHGLPYNNQDTRDALPYGLRIFSIGVQFFGPSIPQYQTMNGNEPQGEANEATIQFTNELPKHCSVILQTNQDERLRIASLMTPGGVGTVGGGVSQGDPEGFGLGMPNGGVWANGQGVSMLSNKWGFYEPLEVPRRANVSVRLNINKYGQELLTAINGPFWHPCRSVTGDGTFSQGIRATAGIRVILGGQRLVQQRAQYHA